MALVGELLHIMTDFGKEAAMSEDKDLYGEVDGARF